MSVLMYNTHHTHRRHNARYVMTAPPPDSHRQRYYEYRWKHRRKWAASCAVGGVRIIRRDVEHALAGASLYVYRARIQIYKYMYCTVGCQRMFITVREIVVMKSPESCSLICVLICCNSDCHRYADHAVATMLSKLALVLQLLQVSNILDPDARTTDVRVREDQFVHIPKVRSLRHTVLNSELIHLDPEGEVDLVEANVVRVVLTSGGNSHREQGALRHGRQRVSSNIALRAGTDGPCARRVVVFEQIADAISVRDCDFPGQITSGPQASTRPTKVGLEVRVET